MKQINNGEDRYNIIPYCRCFNGWISALREEINGFDFQDAVSWGDSLFFIA